eukprot:418409_1
MAEQSSVCDKLNRQIVDQHSEITRLRSELTRAQLASVENPSVVHAQLEASQTMVKELRTKLEGLLEVNANVSSGVEELTAQKARCVKSEKAIEHLVAKNACLEEQLSSVRSSLSATEQQHVARIADLECALRAMVVLSEAVGASVNGGLTKKQSAA